MVLIYLTFFAFHSCHLLSKGKVEINKVSFTMILNDPIINCWVLCTPGMDYFCLAESFRLLTCRTKCELIKLVGWCFVFVCWQCLKCSCCHNVMLERWAHGRFWRSLQQGTSLFNLELLLFLSFVSVCRYMCLYCCKNKSEHLMFKSKREYKRKKFNWVWDSVALGIYIFRHSRLSKWI